MSKMVELNLNPEPRILRQFGFIALVGFGLLAAMAHYERGIFAFGLGSARETVAQAIVAVGIVSAVFSLIWPTGNRPLFVLLSVVTFPIGFVLSYVIMGTLFFALFAPIALLFRAIGRDPLARNLDKGAESYWSKVAPRRPKSDYFKQY